MSSKAYSFLKGTLLVYCMLLVSCSNSSSPSSQETPLEPATLDIALRLNPVASFSPEGTSYKTAQSSDPLNPNNKVPTIDSVYIRLSATGLFENAEHVYSAPYSDTLFPRFVVPPDSNWFIEVELHTDSSAFSPLYRGTFSNLILGSGEYKELSVPCVPQFSELSTVFPLEPDSSKKAQYGSMMLTQGEDTLQTSLSIQGDVGSFHFMYVPINKWDIYMTLYNKDSTLLYTSRDSIHIIAGAQRNKNLVLSSHTGEPSLSLQLLSTPKNTLSFHYAHSRKRNPKPQEVVFTELYPSPSLEEGGELGEWIEITNRTTDSISLDSCSIRKTRSSTASSTSYHFISGDVGDILLAGESRVLGRSQVPHPHIPYLIRLTGTKQSLLLLCKDQLIDSITYTSEYTPTDSIYNKAGYVSTKKQSKLGQESMADNWCLTHVDSTRAPSPGSVRSYCDE
jgi:hypothetical protein